MTAHITPVNAGQNATSPCCGPARRGAAFGTPLTLTEPRTRGQVLFMRECNGRHPGGAAGLGPGLANKPLPGFALRTQLHAAVCEMPALTEERLADAQVDAIVEYVHALEAASTPR